MMWTSGVKVSTSSPLQVRLAMDWARLDEATGEGCWCRATSCWCQGLGTPDECAERLQAGDDLLALRLQARASRGDVAAARVLLQALLPLLAAPSGRASDLDESLGLAWERVVRHRPTSRANVLANLARACRRDRLVETRQPSVQCLFELHEVSQRDTVRADEVIVRALGEGVIDSLSAELLDEVYVQGRSSQDVGRRHGLSPEGVRTRSRRAVEAIRREWADDLVGA